MSRPWEQQAGLRSWETQQPLYPRTVSIRRQQEQTGGGVKPYAGEIPADETVVASGLPASIQFQRLSGAPDAKVPSDAYNRAGWNIFVPMASASLGEITELDVVVDDLGKRYQVTAAYWNSLGYKIAAELLEP